MNALVIRNRRTFIVRNNRCVTGEWHVYPPSALPYPVPFVSSEELDKLLDKMQKVATVQVDELAVTVLSGRLPETMCSYAIARCIAELDG